MPFPEQRILVLDGQTNQALACVRSLGRAGASVFVASPTTRPLAAWSRYCRGSFRHAGDTVTALADARAWAREQGIHVVLPQRERTCLLCDADRAEWERSGMTLGCGPADMLLRAFDKARTLTLAQTCGVRFPPTRFPTSLAECHTDADAVGYPCVVKPRLSDFWDGDRFVAAHGAQYVCDPADLDATVIASRQDGLWPLIQGVVPGRGIGVFALYDHGTPLVWFAHERLRDVRPSGSGSSLRRSIPVDARLREPAERLLSAMAWHGPVMVEFRDAGGSDPCLMEVNGRFWNSLALAVASGVDFPKLWTALLCGQPADVPANYETGVTLRWLWGDVKRLLYILAGPPAGYPGPYPSLRDGLREILGSQPPGTSSETWSSDDRWPSVGEWVQGCGELGRVVSERLTRRQAAPAVAVPLERLVRPKARPGPRPTAVARG